jgi:hypothetical protein
MSPPKPDNTKVKKRTFRTAAPGHISVELYSNSGFAPLKNLKYRIRVSRDRILEGTTDDKGYIHHDNVPIGEYPMELEGYDGSVKIPSLPIGVDREPIRVPGYMLFHEDSRCDEPEDDSDYDDEILLGDLDDHAMAAESETSDAEDTTDG